VLEKLKEFICGYKPQLMRWYEQHDPNGTGVISLGVTVQGLRDVVQGVMPWEDYMSSLATIEPDETVLYRSFLGRYRIASAQQGWQTRMLSSLMESISSLSLHDTLEVFDPNHDGVVSFDELRTVLSRFAIGLSYESIDALTKQLLGGKESLRTAELLELLDVQYTECGQDGEPPRTPPAWAAPLLEAVAKQCAVRQADSIELFQQFDGDGDGYISAAEFQQAMLKLGAHDGAPGTPDQHDRVSSMLLDLARAGPALHASAHHSAVRVPQVSSMLLDLASWLDKDGDGKIAYLEFINAFKVGAKSTGTGDAAEPASEASRERTSAISSAIVHAAGGAIEELLEHLCALFYRHRWSLKHAFEYFDANGDGVLSPEEFATALKALSTMSLDDEEGIGRSAKAGEDHKEALRLTDDQADRLVASLDRNSDGVIDYDEFLSALQASALIATDDL